MSNVSVIAVSPLFASRCLVANFVKYRPLFPSKCLRLGVIDPKHALVFSCWILHFYLLFLVTYIFIIYFLLCVCNSPLFPNYFARTLNAELNPICHMLALLEAHHILHVSRIRVKIQLLLINPFILALPIQ